ncbi:sulfotransferase [Shewanella sp.]|uniref:sulfotransferase n=1 Tax=Shewanella sp. TaxID=50422 RepID=UPI003D1312A5
MSSLSQAQDYLAKGEYLAASRLFNEALKQPLTEHEKGLTYLGLGELALLQGDARDAEQLINKACGYLSGETIPLELLARAYNLLGDHEDALMVLNYANQIAPDSAELRYQLGVQQVLMGEPIQAKSHFLLALNDLLTDVAKQGSNETASQSPVVIMETEVVALGVDCLLALARLGHQVTDRRDELIGLLTYLKRANTLTDACSLSMKVKLAYAEAQLQSIYNQQDATPYFESANKLQHSLTPRSTEEQIFVSQSVRGFISPDSLVLQANANQFSPTFVIALPLGGFQILRKTLLSMGNCHVYQEASSATQTVLDEAYRLTAKHYPRCVLDLNQVQLNELAERYLVKLSQMQSSEGRLAPDNMGDGESVGPFIKLSAADVQVLPLLMKLFPQARVIHLNRELAPHTQEVMLHYFANSPAYLCDAKEFAAFRDEYLELVGCWKALMPDSFLTLNVEDLALSPKESQDLLFEFCNKSKEG